MKMKFRIHYSTSWGESLHVVLTYHYIGGGHRRYDLPMTTSDGVLWTLETSQIESRRRSVESFDYYYAVESGDGKELRREWEGAVRRFHFDPTKDYIFPDRWRDVPLQNHLLTACCHVCTGRKPFVVSSSVRLPLYRRTVIFRVLAPQLADGQSLAVCGNLPSLGSWNPARFLRMRRIGDAEWTLSVNVDNVATPLEYKYVVVDDKTNTLVAWEEGDNRTTEGIEVADGDVLVLYGENLRVKEKPWRAAGVAVPVFSLRSDKSFGVGDFGDLRRLVDWCAEAGLHMIQLLPVFDTTTTHTWTDSHPYDCISFHALHPHYIDLDELCQFSNDEDLRVFNRQRREMNALEYSDYEGVDRLKLQYIAKAFDVQGGGCLESDEYKAFAQKNSYWLYPYSAFCALRERYHTARTSDWHEYSVYDEKKLERLYNTNETFHRSADIACFVQYHLHRQLKAAADYARRHGVVFCGDMPASLYRDSVTTWVHPEYFHLDMKLGNPPSPDEPHGQSWGMPPFDWYPDDGRWVAAYLAGVLKGMEEYFDAVRIDHIVSFFRSWEIPREHLWASMGHFTPSIPFGEGEIRQYGLDFHKELFTRPFINDNVLYRFFGIHASFVRDNYLEKESYNLYRLKDDYDTQRKIDAHFAGRHDENSLWIRDGLMHLCANVLFLADPYREGLYYPRFGAFSEPVYSILSPEGKDAYMRLYNNFYYERHNAYWENLAQRKLEAVIGGTLMLVVGEDLGMRPPCLPGVLDRERVLSMEVQSMPKQTGEEFAHLEAYPYRSVAIPTTHDMSPLRLWWEEDRGRTQRFWAQMLQKEGRAPRHLPATTAEEIVTRHIYCPSMICMFSIQDLLAIDPNFSRDDIYSLRINAPFDAYNQWKYRMRPTIDELISADQLNGKIKTLITRSKRL